VTPDTAESFCFSSTDVSAPACGLRCDDGAVIVFCADRAAGGGCYTDGGGGSYAGKEQFYK